MIPRPDAPSRAVLAVLCLLLGAAPAAAQLTEKEAVKALKSEVKNESRDAKTGIKNAVSSLDAAVKALISDVKNGNFGPAQEIALQAALKDFQSDLLFAVFLAQIDLVGGIDDVLPQLTPTGGIYPEDFYFGSGSLLGDFEARVEKDYAKGLAKADKSLAKLAKTLNDAGVGFTWRLVFQRRLLAVSYNPGDGAPVESNRSVLGLLYALSDLETADDGELCVIGGAPNTMDDVNIQLIGGQPEATLSETTVGEAVGEETVLCHCFTGLTEGNYLVEVWPENERIDSHWASLGVR